MYFSLSVHDLARLRGLEKRLETSGRGGAAECGEAGSLRCKFSLWALKDILVIEGITDHEYLPRFSRRWSFGQVCARIHPSGVSDGEVSTTRTMP